MSNSARLRDLASRLSRLETTSPEETALLSFFAGAVYALNEASSLGYGVDSSRSFASSLDRGTRSVLKAVASDDSVDADWLGGYYFNDALMRLAALNERVDKYAAQGRDLAPSVRQAVNDLKHDIDPHIEEGLDIGLNDVLEAAEVLVSAFEKDLRTRAAS
jgi:hypothetical protein